MKQLFLLASLFLILANQLSAQPYFTVKFPDDRVVGSCGGPAAADTIWPEISTTPYCSFGVGVAVHDQVFYTNGFSCGKILRRFTLLYWCDYNPNWTPTVIPNPSNTDVGPTVVADKWNHGYLEYTQIIKMGDGLPPKFLDCPTQTPVVFCDYTTNDPKQYNSYHMDLCEGIVNLKTRVTDVCSKTNLMISYRIWLDLDGNGIIETFRSSSDSLAWPIDLSTQNDTLNARVKFPSGFALPYGKHMLEWIAMDNCGNKAICKFPFIVKDCNPPTAVCYNGLSVNIMETKMITLWASDFLQKTWDNCTPTQQIKVAVRKAGAGTGFPLNGGSVTFDCSELGEQQVEVWVADAYGNATFCKTYVDVQDPFDDCNSLLPGGDDRGNAGPADLKNTFYPARPNPASELVTLPFDLAFAGEIRLNLLDLDGRVLSSQAKFFPKGSHQMDINLGDVRATGVLVVQIESASGRHVQRIVKM